MTDSAKVLVVDDNRTSRLLAGKALKQLGCSFVEAATGQEALDLLGKEDFDLVLLDIEMPDMDGLSVLRQMRAEGSRLATPVLVISGLEGDMNVVVAAIELGAEDFLPKPFDPTLFRARVMSCIEKKRLRAAELDYLAQVDRIASAAAIMEERAFHPKNLGLEPVIARQDATGRLARVFAEMAQQVYDRERALIRSVRTAKGVVLLVLSGIVGGLMTPMSVMLYEDIPMATGLSFWGDLLPGILCLGGAAIKGHLGRISRQTLAFLFMWAVLNVAAGILVFEAAGHVSGIVLSIILALEGLGVFLIAAVMRMEDPTPRRFIGLIIGLAGILALILARDTDGGTNAWLWILIAIIVPVLWAITDVLIAARGSTTTFNPIAGLGVMYLMSAAMTLPLALAQGQFFMLDLALGTSFWLILLNAVVDTLNYVFYVLLIAVAGAVFGSQAAYVTTLAGIFWSILLLGEQLSSGTILALVLIIVGLLVVGPKSEAVDLEVQFIPQSKRKGRSALPWSLSP